MSFQRTKTVKAQQFAPEIGNLTLLATVVAQNEVMLNLTFSGTGVYNNPGYVWTIWISNSTIPNYRNLSEGLLLVEGTSMLNSSCPVPGSFLSFQTRIRAVADGEWVVYGWFSAIAGPGFSHALSTDGIKINVSNGSIVQLEKALYPNNSTTQMPTIKLPNNSTEQPTNPPVHPTNP